MMKSWDCGLLLVKYLCRLPELLLLPTLSLLRYKFLASCSIFTTLLCNFFYLVATSGLSDLLVAWNTAFRFLIWQIIFLVSQGTFLLPFNVCCGMHMEMTSMNFLCQLVAAVSISSSGNKLSQSVSSNI